MVSGYAARRHFPPRGNKIYRRDAAAGSTRIAKNKGRQLDIQQKELDYVAAKQQAILWDFCGRTVPKFCRAELLYNQRPINFNIFVYLLRIIDEILEDFLCAHYRF